MSTDTDHGRRKRSPPDEFLKRLWRSLKEGSFSQNQLEKRALFCGMIAGSVYPLQKKKDSLIPGGEVKEEKKRGDYERCCERDRCARGIDLSPRTFLKEGCPSRVERRKKGGSRNISRLNPFESLLSAERTSSPGEDVLPEVTRRLYMSQGGGGGPRPPGDTCVLPAPAQKIGGILGRHRKGWGRVGEAPDQAMSTSSGVVCSSSQNQLRFRLGRDGKERRAVGILLRGGKNA